MLKYSQWYRIRPLVRRAGLPRSAGGLLVAGRRFQAGGVARAPAAREALGLAVFLVVLVERLPVAGVGAAGALVRRTVGLLAAVPRRADGLVVALVRFAAGVGIEGVGGVDAGLYGLVQRAPGIGVVRHVDLLW